MKPIKLEMAAWGPYKDKQTVDFEKLGNRGLFLISGHTGAGKTTIFDGICFALFGCASGTDREKESFRSDFADPEEKTYVNLVFTHKNIKYIIERNPKYLRPKARGEGFTTEDENATLKMFVEDETEIIATRSREVTEKINEIIGVDYDQFKQIAMIAQGEFQNLLTADSKERTRIFRDIFNTGIYEKIQKEITERTKVIFKELTDLNSRLEEAVNGVNLNADHEWEELVSCKDKDYKRLNMILEKEINSDKETEIQIEKILKELDKELEEKNNLLNEIQRIEKIKKEIVQAEAEYNILIARAEEYTLKKAQLQKAEKYLRVRPAADLYESSVNNHKKSVQAEKNLKDMLNELEIKIQKNNEEVRKVDDLNKQNENAKELIQGSKTCIELIEIYIKSEKELNKFGEEYVRTKSISDASRNKYEDALEKRKLAAIGIVAKELEDGKPCPVCGSREHPDIAEYSEELPDEKMVEKLKKEAQKAEKTSTEAYAKAESKKEIIRKYEEDFKTESYKLIRNELNIIDVKNACSKEEEIIEIQKKYSKILEDNTNLINQINEVQIKLEKEYNLKKGQFEQKKNDNVRLCEEEKNNKINLENVIKEFGFKDNDDFNSAKIEESDAGSLRKDIETYSEKVINIKSGIEKMKVQVLDEKKENTEDVIVDRNEIVSNQKLNRNKKEELHARIVQNSRQYDSISKKIEDITELQNKYAVIKGLESIIRGDNPRHIIFEDYVLSMYFDQILVAANLRLKKMSEGRYELLRKIDNISARSKEVLDIEVMDNYTGKRRPSSSLSGGEKFKAALALAFGTSDIVQNNVGGIEIETLFIDEGFGSLDEESLDAAIDALLTVSKDNRLVGIISHVGELKTRICNQIEIEKINTGSRIIQ